MSSRAIVPVKLSLTEGDVYTLWAPIWQEHGSEWQAFLGDDDHVLAFHSPAALLAFLESGQPHDLVNHPNWEQYQALPADRVVPGPRDEYDIVGAPAYLADRPSYDNVAKLAGVFEVTDSLGTVTTAEDAVIFFASHSVLRNVERGAEHFAGAEGFAEWTTIGSVVASNWPKLVESLDEAVRVVEGEEDEETAARIDAATAAAEREREEAETRRAAELEKADPYDLSIWGEAGVDPIKLSLQGKSVYTLRTFIEGRPVFLGRFGEIHTFPTTKLLVRWIMDNDEHDLAGVSTWETLTTAAHSGDLEVTVHRDNAYSFTGISKDIEKGPEEVDTAQMNQAYELMADAADWAGDDSLNEFLLANPRFQDYLSYMLGSTDSAGYVPSRPYTDKAQAWDELEDMLVKRFSKF